MVVASFRLLLSWWWRQVLEALIGGTDFSEEDAEKTLRLLLDEKDEARISAFLVLLRAKGETYEEVWFVFVRKRLISLPGARDGLDFGGR